MTPPDLIATARRTLGNSGKRRPRQSDLKRAMSTAYYAVFHQLCWTVADSFIGGKSAERSTPAWRQAYRSIDHGFAKTQCRNSNVMNRFPQAVQDLANAFVELQIARHAADYDPLHRLVRSEVKAEIDRAEQVIRGFRTEPIKDRRAFAAWITLKNRS
ncbi:hypothetical protein [Alterinioella nitratireducens]|uniref:hypothetical protein n=1 Tax=Alterinioella nitratireducens TaxID=2735915 RepID=UPI001552641D|nr:hypothetical protein [Alterinioella nitratireducens]NPD19634.1 hypothetical protein [Alterinioella nitratireducens]